MQRILTFFVFSLLSLSSFAQQEDPTKTCSNLLTEGFISDGKNYVGKLNANNKAIFHVTFFSENTYRLIACSKNKKHTLLLKIYDTDKNLLFDNSKHNYTTYWDLKFTSTVNCLVEIELEAENRLSDVVQLLIGFKQK
ncbi:MAG: hypothetical protein R6U66_09825 [Bacteroidales bacterium]